MLASYAVVLRRSAVITAPAAALMIVLSAVLGGSKGLVGALLGVGLVAAFFGASALVVSVIGKRRPGAATGAAVATYIVKVLLLLLFVAKFSNTTLFNGKIFGLAAIGCVLVWSAAQAVISSRLKVAYVEPEGPKRSRAPHGAIQVPSPPPDKER
jgi:ATP synthase protein I